MSAYYNEIEPYAAQWLRNLMTKGLIPDGEVDTRSIVDVSPDDLRSFSQCHFFAGIGGWSRALRLAGWPDDRPVWTGSCPCQPFSVAGKGLGADDPRHLWPHFHRLIAACRPPVVFGEQVSGAAGYGWLDGVRSDLAREKYSCEAFDIPACAIDAPHIRSRLYWVASDMADAHVADEGDGRVQRCRQQRGAGRDSSARDCGDMADANHRHARKPGDTAATDGARRQHGPHVDNGCASCDMADADHGGRASGVNAGSGDAADGGREADGQPGGGGDVAHANVSQSRAGRGDDGKMRGVPAAQCRAEDGAAVSAGGGATDGGDMADAASDGREVENFVRTSRREKAQERETDEHRGAGVSFWSDAVWLTGADGKARRAQPGLPLLAHGIPARVGRLRAYGNAIVPQLAAEVIGAFMDVYDAE